MLNPKLSSYENSKFISFDFRLISALGSGFCSMVTVKCEVVPQNGAIGLLKP